MVDEFDVDVCDYNDVHELNSQLESHNICVIHVNIRSFNANFDEFSIMLSELIYPPAVIVLTETWFTPNFQADIGGYESFHVYRNGRGGGVSVYVDGKYSSRRVDSLCVVSDVMEVCSVVVSIRADFKIKICGVYRPPNRNNIINFNESFFNIISNNISRSDKMLILGDFNINLCDPSNDETDLLQNFYSNSFFPCITKPTRITQNSSTCIDHIWTNMLSNCLSGIIDFKVTDHLPVYILFNVAHASRNMVEIKFRDHSSHNVDIFIERIVNLVNLYDDNFCADVNNSTAVFCASLYSIYDASFPIKRKYISENRFNRPWITNDFMYLINFKHSLFRRFRRGEVTYGEFKEYSNNLTNNLRNKKVQYFRNKFMNYTNNIKQSWKTVNSLIKGNKSNNYIREIKTDINEVTRDPTQIASNLNKHFSNIGSILNDKIPQSNVSPIEFMGNRNDNSMFITPSTPVEVQKIISSFVNKSGGIHSIPTFIYKKIVHLISPVISRLFNESVVNGIFPSCLKVARVVPIFKDDDKRDVNNYRPISLLPFLSKVFEKLMYERLNDFFESNSILRDNQFGFRKCRGTEDTILEFINEAYKSLNDKNIFTVVYLDFSKAFDTVSHEILLAKLDHVGVRGVGNSWFRSFLSNRRQYVHVNDCDSSMEYVQFGVAQGSVLGPLLFILYINDMANVFHNLKCIHYADDTTLHYANNNIDDVVRVVNDELSRVDSWLISNKLSVNFKKTSYMTISNSSNVINIPIHLRNVRIAPCDHTKLLGVVVDNNLNFHRHVDHITSKLSRSIGVLNRISNLMPNNVIRKLYFSMLYPYLNYCVTAFGNSNMRNIKKLERAQFKFCKFFNDNNQDKINILKNQYILPYKEIYKYFTMLKFYKCINHNQHRYFLSIFNDYLPDHDHNTRFSSANNLNIPDVRLTRCRASFVFNAVSIWNTLPYELKIQPSLIEFKKSLKIHYLQS